jgi:hypothetical protein
MQKPKFCVWQEEKSMVCKKFCLQKSRFGNEAQNFILDKKHGKGMSSQMDPQ